MAGPDANLRPFARAALLVALAGALTACSSFRGSRRLDMGPFGENTVQMVGEMQKFNRPAPWVYLKKYQTHPAVSQVGVPLMELRNLMRGIAFYSLQVVAINESRLSEEAKLRELARYLESTVRPMIPDDPEVNFSREDFDGIVREVRTRKTFMDGLSAAQPLVNAAQNHGLKLFERFDEVVGQASGAINAALEEEFGPLKRNIGELEQLQERAMEGMTLIYKHRLGEAGALDSLRRLYPPVTEQLPSGRVPTAKQLEAAELELMAQLDRIRRLKEQLVPEFVIYKECQRELEALRILNEDRARLGRATLVLWARSHKNLGVGVTVPPVIDMLGLVQKATGAAASSAGKLVPGL
jgi:hypothetical protein